MSILLSAIDTVYDGVMRVSVHTVETVMNAYVRGGEPIAASTEDVREVARTTEPDVEEPASFKTLDDVLRAAAARKPVTAVRNTVMYTAQSAVHVYKEPTTAFDSRLGTIPYGEMVMMLEPRGRFFHVMWGELDGWVLRDDLIDRAAGIQPTFIIGEENNASDESTKRTRQLIHDEFGTISTELPLQAGEYIIYKLHKKGTRIAWPPMRPRIPGLWHTILRGAPGVHVAVTPKAGSVMEYLFENEVGHLAYVEAVFPDDTISVSEANFPDRGIYNERELTREEWRELRPVFIRIS